MLAANTSKMLGALDELLLSGELSGCTADWGLPVDLMAVTDVLPREAKPLKGQSWVRPHGKLLAVTVLLVAAASPGQSHDCCIWVWLPAELLVL